MSRNRQKIDQVQLTKKAERARKEAERRVAAASKYRASKSSFMAKLNRAIEYLDEIEPAHEAWMDADKPCSVFKEKDLKRGQYVVKVKRTKDFPSQLQVLIGDCIHNLRACLDHLAYALAKANASGTIADEVARTSEFPIFGDRDSQGRSGKGRDLFERYRERKIGTIAEDAQAVIERLQPYQRGDDFAVDPLWLLHALDAVDKHRHVHLMAFHHGAAEDWEGKPHGGLSMIASPNAFEDEAIVAEYPIAGDPNVEMKLRFAFGVAFSEGAAQGQPVIATLTLIKAHIEDVVIPRLTPYL